MGERTQQGGDNRRRGGGGGGAGGGGGGRRRRVCRFCADHTLKVDYKDAQAIRYFITERGKIVPRRISGTCAKHQRQVCIAVKRARNIALMPFTAPK